MKKLLLVFSLATTAFAQDAVPPPSGVAVPQTALQALKALPFEDVKNLARIVAREGTPNPERWYFIVYDAKAPQGFHECVVAGGEMVVSRHISQFVSRLRSGDIIGNVPLHIDSDAAAKIARDYADANRLKVASFNFELAKDGDKAAPVWAVSCLNAGGDSVGELFITAALGSVVMHEGFSSEPGETTAKTRTAKGPVVQGKPQARTEDSDAGAKPESSTAARSRPKSRAASNNPTKPEVVEEKPSTNARPTTVAVGKAGSSTTAVRVSGRSDKPAALANNKPSEGPNLAQRFLSRFMAR